MAKEDNLKSKAKNAKQSVAGDQHTSRGSRSPANKMLAFGPMITLLAFSTAMLILPLVTYFGIRHYIINSTTYSAMGAIVMVQIIVAAYIYRAWNDEKRDHEKQIEKLKKR